MNEWSKIIHNPLRIPTQIFVLPGLLMIIEKLPLKLSGLVRNVGNDAWPTWEHNQTMGHMWMCLKICYARPSHGNFSKEYLWWMNGTHTHTFSFKPISDHNLWELVSTDALNSPLKIMGSSCFGKCCFSAVRRLNNTPIVTCLVDFEITYQLLTAHGYEDKEKSMRYVSFGDFHSHLAWGSGGLMDAPYDLELGFCWG